MSRYQGSLLHNVCSFKCRRTSAVDLAALKRQDAFSLNAFSVHVTNRVIYFVYRERKDDIHRNHNNVLNIAYSIPYYHIIYTFVYLYFITSGGVMLLGLAHNLVKFHHQLVNLLIFLHCLLHGLLSASHHEFHDALHFFGLKQFHQLWIRH